MKRKIAAITCALALAMTALAGCGGQSSPAGNEKEAAAEETTTAEAAAEPTTEAQAADAAAEAATEAPAGGADETVVRVAALKGPTAMGMVSLMQQAQAGAVDGVNYECTIASAVDEVPPMLIKGDVDIAALPANMASVLYNKTEGGVQVLAVNTLGVLYIVENGETISTAADLKGRTIYASGKGATPEYALRYILAGSGIDPDTDVQIEWKSEHTECLAAVLEDPDGAAMLPQPFVTTALMKNEGMRVALDLTEEWKKAAEAAGSSSGMITGVVIVRSAFAAEHPDLVEAFLNSYEASVRFTNENIEEAAQLVESFDIVPAAVAQKAIPACNIVCIRGAEMKDALSGYLDVLAAQNPEAVGGKVPAEDFYYGN